MLNHQPLSQGATRIFGVGGIDSRAGKPPTGAGPDLATFIRDNTRLCAVPHVPEIALYVADEAVPLWHRTEAELGGMGLPPHFGPSPGLAVKRWRAT